MARRGILDPDWAQHPDLGESLIPVWGSAREAAADWHDGDYLGAVGNGVLALSDFVPAKALGTVAVKAGARAGAKLAAKGTVQQALKEAGRGVVKLRGSKTWDAVRKDMTRAGIKPPAMPGHHAFIPQNGWGKNVPDWIKNQPLNIKILTPETHRLVHGNKVGGVRYGTLRRTWYGSPDWAKAVTIGGPARVAVVGRENSD